MQDIIKTWLPLVLAFITGSFALFQIRSNNITNARLKWLETLRQLITEFFAECNIMHWKEIITVGVDERRHVATIASETDSFIQKNNQDIVQHLTNIDAKTNLIKLNLNPKEPLHIKLEKLLDDYIDVLNKIPGSKSSQAQIEISRSLNTYSDTINLLIRYMLKLEWEKTKRLSVSRYYYFKLGNGRKLKKEALGLQLLSHKHIHK